MKCDCICKALWRCKSAYYYILKVSRLIKSSTNTKNQTPPPALLPHWKLGPPEPDFAAVITGKKRQPLVWDLSSFPAEVILWDRKLFSPKQKGCLKKPLPTTQAHACPLTSLIWCKFLEKERNALIYKLWHQELSSLHHHKMYLMTLLDDEWHLTGDPVYPQSGQEV